MEALKLIITKWSLSICAVIIGLTFYGGISTPTWYGGIGTILLVTVCAASLEFLLQKEFNKRLPAKIAFLMITECIVYAVFANILPGVAYRQVIISLFLFMLLFTLFLYILRQNKLQIHEAIFVFAFFFSIGVALYTFVFYFGIGSFSPDSYSYYEIAETMFHDYGHVGTVRQYVYESEYNCSFPYMYPMLLYFVDKVTGLGIYAGCLLNLMIIGFTVHIIIKISREFSGKFWPGMLTIILLLINSNYLSEVTSARSIPATILCMLWIVYFCMKIWMSEEKKISDSLLVGVLSGMVPVLRFDGLAWFCFGIFVIMLINKKRRIMSVMVYVLGGLIFLSPWILYSYVNFGKIWCSDNNGTLFLVEAMVPNRVVLENSSIETLFSAPFAWVRALIRKCFNIFNSLLRCSWGADLILAAGIWEIIRDLEGAKKFWDRQKEKILFLGVFFVYYVAKTGMYVLVGYGDPRYHVETVVVVILLLLSILSGRFNDSQWEKLDFAKGTLLILIMCTAILMNRGTVVSFFTGYKSFPMQKVGVVPENIRLMEEQLERLNISKEADIMPMNDAFTFGGWSERHVLVPPTNLTIDTVQYVIDTYGRDMVYVMIKKDGEEYSRSEALNEVVDHLEESTEKRYDIGEYEIYEIKKEVQG